VSTATDVKFLEGIELDKVPPCETIWCQALGDQIIMLGDMCSNPAAARVKIKFECGKIEIRWKCEECLEAMQGQARWGCVKCGMLERFFMGRL
jgi:hypothetical protein